MRYIAQSNNTAFLLKRKRIPLIFLKICLIDFFILSNPFYYNNSYSLKPDRVSERTGSSYAET